MKRIIFLLSLLSPLFALSQSNYHKGSITNNNGEVLTGYINYGEWVINPVEIEFKEHLDDSKPKIFYPKSIKSFVLTDLEKYDSYTGKISMNKTLFTKLADNADTTTKSTSIFIKLIADGPNVKLFSFTDAIKTRYFVQNKQEQPAELLYQIYYNDTRSQTIKTRRYIWQLRYIISQYVSSDNYLLNQLEKISYEENDIKQIVDAVNGTQKSSVKTKQSNLRFFAGGGFNLIKTSFVGNDDLVKSKQPVNNSPQLSVGLDFFNHNNSQRYLVRLQASAWYVNPNFTNVTTGKTYSFSQWNVGVGPQFMFNFYNTKAVKIYADAGVNLNISTYPTNKLPYTAATLSIDQVEGTWFSFPLQAGVIIKNIELFATYSFPSSINRDTGFSINNEWYGVGIHYLFGKNK
jgi:hypothetical protein